MTNLEILHSTYKRFYKEMKTSQDYNSKDFLYFNLESFTEAVLEDFYGDFFRVNMESGKVTNSTNRILFSVSARHNKRIKKNGVSYVPQKTRLAVMSNGDIVTFDKEVKKTGSQTFTGDVYVDCYGTTFTIKETLYKSELFSDFSSVGDITSEQIESVAVEMAQEIIELHDQEKFHV